MRRGLISGLVCDCAIPVRVGATLGAFMSCRQDGNPATVAAVTALREGGHVVYDSRRNRASAAPAILKNFHFTFGPSLWEPAYDDEGSEVPKDRLNERFLLVVKGAVVRFAKHRTGTRNSVIWAEGDLQSWAAALGDLVLAYSPVFSEEYLGTLADGDNRRPTLHAVVNLAATQ